MQRNFAIIAHRITECVWQCEPADASVVRANDRCMQHRVLCDATLFVIENSYECIICGSVNRKPRPLPLELNTTQHHRVDERRQSAELVSEILSSYQQAYTAEQDSVAGPPSSRYQTRFRPRG